MKTVQENQDHYQHVANVVQSKLDVVGQSLDDMTDTQYTTAFFKTWKDRGMPSDMAGWNAIDSEAQRPPVRGYLPGNKIPGAYGTWTGGAKRPKASTKASTKASGKASTKASRPPSRYANTGRKRDGKTVYRNRQTGAEYCKCKSAKTGKMTYRKLA